MGHGRDTCELCSGPSTRRRPRAIEGQCETCLGRVCRKHLAWLDGWICKRCLRRRTQVQDRPTPAPAQEQGADR